MKTAQKRLLSYDPAADIAIGISDGLVIPFALAAGLTGAMVSNNIIVIAGLVEIAAGSIALGIGGYLTAKSEYPKFTISPELRSQSDPQERKNKLDEFFGSLGLTGSLKEQAVDELVADKQKWDTFLQNYQGNDIAVSNQLFRSSAITISTSFIIGGIVPLSPFFFLKDGMQALMVSTGLALALLLVFGFLKGRRTGSGVRTAFVETLIGLLAGAAAFMVGRFFVHP